MDLITLTNLINLYFILAIGYNVVSLVRMDLRGQGLAPTEPGQAIVMMALVYVIHASLLMLGLTPWALLMAVFIALIIRFGIFRHVFGYSSEVYSSRAAWVAAIGINIFGVTVLTSHIGQKVL